MGRFDLPRVATLGKKDKDGICVLKELASVALGSPSAMIGDIEALLIQAMGLSNKANMKFREARNWEQVRLHEIDRYLDRV